MDFLINTRQILYIYLECLQRTAKLSRKYWWALFTIFGYEMLYYAMAFFAAPLGMVGGFLMGLGLDAIVSSFLVTVENIVRDQRPTLNDFKKSFWVYFFDIMGVLFVLWLVSFVFGPMVSLGQGWLIVAIQAAIFILFNPMPELIYYAHHGTLELFSRSYQFIQANWIEWFIPNILLSAALYYLYVLPLPVPEWIEMGVKAVFFAFAIYFVMIFRGLLFASLHHSSRRMRLFQYKAKS